LLSDGYREETNSVTDRKTSDTVFVKDLDGMFNMKEDENIFDKMYRLGHWEEH